MTATNIDSKIKQMIESNPVALATVMPDGKPNVIGVAYVIVVNSNTLLITDNYMKQTILDIKHDPHVVVLVWDKKMNGYKCIGIAEYYNSGKWVETVKHMSVNKGFPAKGAIVVTVSKIIKTA